MAMDATPAAVPGPPDPPPGTPPPGTFDLTPTTGLAAMLAPVDPARPTPGPVADGATDTAVDGASSSAYHGTEEGKKDGTDKATEKKGIMRAWLLAGATRWAKGGGVQNKRLEYRKAKAQANQVKETRQVSVNRSAGSGSATKSSTAGGPTGKSLASKGNTASPKASKNANSGAVKSPSGRSGSATAGPGGSAGRNAGGAPNKKDGGNSLKGRGDGSRGPKSSKDEASKGRAGGSGGGTGGGKDSTPGAAGASGKSGGAAGAAGKAPDAKAGKASTPKDGSAKDDAFRKDGKTDRRPWDRNKDATAKDTSPAKPETPGAKSGKPETPSTPADKTSTPDDSKKAGKDNAAGTAQPVKAPDATAKTEKAPEGKKLATQPSREAGYQDGTRAARAAAHVTAYRDGAKDGWTDTTQAAAREKARLDKAHQERKTARDKEQPVSAGSSADYHKPEGPKPIPVKAVTATHVFLGEGASVSALTRGEVRSLKSFERRLSEKHGTMTKVADDTKLLEAHATSQAAKATKLLERAKAVKGGEKLVGRLVKHEDDAKAQAMKAAEIHKRALRAAEVCGAVLSNAKSRYGGIYKAVVDSDETAPAELAFYKG